MDNFYCGRNFILFDTQKSVWLKLVLQSIIITQDEDFTKKVLMLKFSTNYSFPELYLKYKSIHGLM
jgi:hypothetical protein